MWQHCCWRDTIAGVFSSAHLLNLCQEVYSNTVTTFPSFCCMFPWAYAAAVDVDKVSRLMWFAPADTCSAMSPFSSGEWWLLPFLHSHLRLQQPGEQHAALPHPSDRTHQPPQLDRQEEEQEEGPQEFTYDKKTVSSFLFHLRGSI